MEILCFFAGIAFIYIHKAYALSFLLATLFLRPQKLLFFAFISGVSWGVLHKVVVTADGMPKQEVIRNATLQGYISSLPRKTGRKVQFQFRAKTLNNKPVNSSLLLSCYEHCPHFSAGQRWQFKTKLKKPHNLRNPGGFDYVGLLHAHHIHWTGYIVRDSFKLLKEASPLSLLRFREHLGNRLADHLPEEKILGLIQALTLGITTHVATEDWELYRRTGTIHLVGISGSHIVLIAGFSFGFMKWLWSLIPGLCLRYPAQKAASIYAMVCAVLYTVLAGMEVPVQRAFIVSFFMLLRYLLSQRFSAWQAWRYALLGVLVVEPHSVLMIGFYLSFLAVAILLLIHQRFVLQKMMKMLVFQIACLCGLMPLSLFWFSYGSINGFLANLVAIPLVEFLIVPLALLVTFFSPWVIFPWSTSILHKAAEGFFHYLYFIDSFSNINVHYSFSQFLSPLALMVAMGLAIVAPRQFLPMIIILALSALWPAPDRIKKGEARVDVLDVGQGLSVIVKTSTHVLIYDTGMKFFQGSDMGQLAIIPYLKAEGIQYLDRIVISHPDLDHRGGLASITEAYGVGDLIVDAPRFYGKGSSCHHFTSWQWDGVTFRFLPIRRALKEKNNHSCILQIVTRGGAMLLTGDIEKAAEQYLLRHAAKKLPSSILLVPHHGSRTSSSIPFLKQVSPMFAIASFGFDNRYHFPNPSVMEDYRFLQIPVFSTEQCGMLRVRLTRSGVVKPNCHKHANNM